MTLRKFLVIVIALLVVLVIALGVTSIDHPIILKWVTGSASHHGKPIPASVYSNGKPNDHIKVFYTDKENNYLLSLADGSSDLPNFINVDLNEKMIAVPVDSEKGFDLIGGHLFQSKTAELKRVTFDAQVVFSDQQIKFKMPPNKFDLDSIRIVFL